MDSQTAELLITFFESYNKHFTELFKTVPAVDAGLAASVFHSGQIRINALKAELAKNGIHVRI